MLEREAFNFSETNTLIKVAIYICELIDPCSILLSYICKLESSNIDFEKSVQILKSCIWRFQVLDQISANIARRVH